MRKIIDGRVYDTTTATELADYEYSNKADFRYFKETLYIKRNREFFLHGQGHALSKYAVPAEGSNASMAGEKIIPFTKEDARQWAEEKLTPEDYEKFFKVEEDEFEDVLKKEQQRAADKRWNNKNRSRRTYLSSRSAARSFIRNWATPEDLKELEELIRIEKEK